MILVYLDVPDDYQRKAEYVFRLFSCIWGIPLRISRSRGKKNPTIVYSKDISGIEPTDSLHIPFDSDYYESQTRYDGVKRNGIYLWTKSSGEHSNPDLIGSTYRLLTFIDEMQVKAENRDRRGIFRTVDLPPGRRTVAQVPLVEQHANHLMQELLVRKPDLRKSMISRWPNGKKYVISLTHDTDAVALGAPAEILTNFVKSLHRRQRTDLEMFKRGLALIGRPQSNPLFGFPVWREFESSYESRSCFYLFTKPRITKFDINDCKSTVTNQKIDWTCLIRMAADGWEFGLHAPIKAKDDLDSFVSAKHLLEEQLQVPIYGVRHHYWALDWLKPYTTFRKHANAGFRYDVSPWLFSKAKST